MNAEIVAEVKEDELDKQKQIIPFHIGNFSFKCLINIEHKNMVSLGMVFKLLTKSSKF